MLLERAPLTGLQDNILKLQVVFPDGQLPRLPSDLNVLHVTQLGRVHTLIVRGAKLVIQKPVAAFFPMLMEALPLSLEEIFIYELGGEDYAVRGHHVLNAALFRKTFLRFWPIWACTQQGWTLVLPLRLWADAMRRSDWAAPALAEISKRRERRPRPSGGRGPLAAGAGLVCAMAVFSYLYSSRSTL